MGVQNVGNVQLVTAPVQGNQIAPLTSAQNVPASVCQFQFKAPTNFGLKIGDTPVAAEVIAYQADGAGQLTGFHGSVVTPGSSASVTLDLLKNGVTVLSATITLTNASTARAIYNGTISALTFVAGDLFSIKITVSSSTGMSGVSAYLNGYEITQPL